MPANKTSPTIQQGPQTTKQYTPLAPEGYTYLTVEELALRLRLSRDSVLRRCRDGSLPGALKFGKLWRIPVKEETPSCK